jgi:nucleoside-diphosphate-sugar epimerase
MGEQNVLVTGANGFLGREIVSLFKASGTSVRATDMMPVCSVPGITYKQADVTKPEGLSRTIDGVTIVIHTAGLAHVFSPDAKSFAKFQQVNEIGTANMATAAAQMGVVHFILISSVSVYGPYTKGIYGENAALNPVGPYALSKYNAEKRAQEISKKARMSLTILRLATLYGEGDPGNVGRLMRALDRGRLCLIGDGNNRKSLLYKGDAARVCLAVALCPANGLRIYNVSAPPCTMREIMDSLSMALGKKPLPVKIPAPIALIAGKFFSCLPEKRLSRLYPTIEKWLAEDVYDTSRIERDYGYHTQVDLIEGLKREVRWYRQNF